MERGRDAEALRHCVEPADAERDEERQKFLAGDRLRLLPPGGGDGLGDRLQRAGDERRRRVVDARRHAENALGHDLEAAASRFPASRTSSLPQLRNMRPVGSSRHSWRAVHAAC